jgi:hypothetical protein
MKNTIHSSATTTLTANAATATPGAPSGSNNAFGHSPFSGLSLEGGALSLTSESIAPKDAASAVAKPVTAPPALKARVTRRPTPIVRKQTPRFTPAAPRAQVKASVSPTGDVASTQTAAQQTAAQQTAKPVNQPVTLNANSPKAHEHDGKAESKSDIWSAMQKALDTRSTVRGIVKQVVEGNGRIYGLRIQLPGTDVLGFAPFTRLGVDITEVHPLLNSEQCFKVIEVNQAKGAIVLNRRQANAQELLDRLIDRVKVGQVLQGRVRNIADCGAFIEIDGACGLIHVSQLPTAPESALRKGQVVTVRVVKLHKERHHLGLNLVNK